jgi:hypothetical protein
MIYDVVSDQLDQYCSYMMLERKGVMLSSLHGETRLRASFLTAERSAMNDASRSYHHWPLERESMTCMTWLKQLALEIIT